MFLVLSFFSVNTKNNIVRFVSIYGFSATKRKPSEINMYYIKNHFLI